MKTIALVCRALFEIVRYELVLWLLGSGRILSQLKRQSIKAQVASPKLEKVICDAVLLATCFYWKPVLCLQRAVCTVRLLRSHGIQARLVIGYRPSPFFSHAWVEINGRVVYGSSAYQTRLLRLHVA
ncbi:MAG TPA: lasso peptide biosynthesis B2 protein [Pyrinomonadaceae bacterium]|nr:lasso peptide biosynthesis B2 protein [Pyrinomonadaceae bacterium]